MQSEAIVRFNLLKTLKRLDLSDADIREEMMVLWLDYFKQAGNQMQQNQMIVNQVVYSQLQQQLGNQQNWWVKK
jgi:hypothetical protein